MLQKPHATRYLHVSSFGLQSIIFIIFISQLEIERKKKQKVEEEYYCN